MTTKCLIGSFRAVKTVNNRIQKENTYDRINYGGGLEPNNNTK